MTKIIAAHKNVGEYYTENILEYEKIRLEQDSPVEYHMMLRLFDQYISEPGVVVDQGVGVGHYAEYLARKSCKLHLVDVTKSFVQLAEQRLIGNGFKNNILSTHHASALHMPFINDESVDFVLMLGPLYHMPDEADRINTVKEAHRILKTGGLIFASAINRLAYFRELFDNDRFFSDKEKLLLPDMRKSLFNYIDNGNLDADLCPFLGDAHLSTSQEFNNLFQNIFKQVEYRGLESFTAFRQSVINTKNQQEKELFLDLVAETGKMADGISCSEHLLYIGQKCID